MSMHSPGQMRQWGSLSSLRKDPSVADQKISRETVRRILGFARPYRGRSWSSSSSWSEGRPWWS